MDHPSKILKAMGGHARKRFGQHFLASTSVVQRIVGLAQLDVGADISRVVEIGPGIGSMTETLLDTGAAVLAVELDRDLAEWQRQRFGDNPRFHLLESDAAKLDYGDVIREANAHFDAALGMPTKPARWQVVSNLPYNVGTGITTELLRHPDLFSRLVLMLQKEVAERMIAPVGDRNRGSLSVFVQSRSEAALRIRVSPGSFYPPPRVGSAVVELVLRPQPLTGGANSEVFERVCRVAFSAPRKAVRNALSNGYARALVDACLESSDVPPTTRAATLDIDTLGRLAMALEPDAHAELIEP